MKLQDITWQRLANQQILNPSHKTVADVVTTLGAMQAQDYQGALWAIGLRLPGSTIATIEEAIAKHEIVRTWPMRGTLHFVPAPDIRWMLELTTPRVISSAAHRMRNLELTDQIFETSREIFLKALQGGRQLSRPAMCQLLEEAKISTKGQRGVHILWRLSQEGLLCFANHEGKQPSFALLEEWAPNANKLSKEDSIALLAKRYFSSHGPATIQDFMWWSGLTSTDAKLGLEQSKKNLFSETYEEKEYWFPDPKQAKKPTLPTFLLPGFDEYMLGYKDRSAALPPLHGHKIVPGNNGMFLSTIVIKSFVAGLWKKTIQTKSVKIKLELFETLSAAELKSITHATKRYGEFLKREVNV